MSDVLDEIAEEEKVRQWYCEQIDDLDRKIQGLSLAEPYNNPSDMARRQLEYEAQRIRSSMHEKLGSSDQMSGRHKSRLHRIQVIEAEMLRLQQRYRDQKHDDSRTAVDSNESRTNNGTSDQYGAHESSMQNGVDGRGQNFSSIYHGAWPINQGVSREGGLGGYVNQDTASVMSFSSSHASSGCRKVPQQHLGTKVEMVYSLLSMLGTHDKDDMSRTLLAMSSSQDSCIAMRQSGCLPLLIQLLHGSDKDSSLLGNTRGSKAARARASAALHNIVHSHPDDKKGRREARVLRLLEQLRAHCDQVQDPDGDSAGNKQRTKATQGTRPGDIDHHPGPAMAALMKLSFDEEHRHAICSLGGLQAIAELLQVDSACHGNTRDQYTITMRRYACMALTNLTFGDGTNKALLCSMKLALQELVNQLESSNEDLAQVAASVLRNLSWRADLASKKALRDVNAVTTLMVSAVKVKKESTLKSILSALWNLSAHCSENKVDICAVEGSLCFLVNSLTYKSPSKTLAIIENGGGILRNISSHIAVREDYRKVLRKTGCLQLLLKHLRSPSLTIVSNACGTLWNLSARCAEDQKALWDMGAVSMLRNLVHSKHKMISMGSAAALKNLLAAKPSISLNGEKKHNSSMPTLQIRKQRAMEAELDQNLAETCENIESPQASPTETRRQRQQNGPKYLYNGDSAGVQDITKRFHGMYSHGKSSSVDTSPVVENKFYKQETRHVERSNSQDSVGSVHSDVTHNRSRSKSNDKYASHKHSDSTPDRDGPSSRIMQMMQEIAMGAGLGDKSQNLNQQQQLSLLSSQMGQMNLNQSNYSQGEANMTAALMSQWLQLQQQQMAKVPLGYGSLPHNTASMNLGRRHEAMNQAYPSMPPNSMQPSSTINSPGKYSSTPYNMYGQNSQSQNVPGAPLVGNFIGSPYVPGRPGNSIGNQPNVSQQCNIASSRNQNATLQAYPVLSSLSGQMQRIPGAGSQLTHQQFAPPQTHPSQNSAFSATYGDNDLDNDQPTNFSLRYSDDTEQTGNFSYSDQQDGDYQFGHQRALPNEFMDVIDGMDDDQVKTFCTEGTPLNYLSTATSMDDLTGISKDGGSHHKPTDGQQGESSCHDEPQNFAMKYTESEHLSGSGTNSTERKTSSTVVESPRSSQSNDEAKKQIKSDNSQPLHIYNDKDNPHSPGEKEKAFFEEGTPLCFSRVSSLSSLHSTDARDQRDFDVTTHNAPLQSIRENEATGTTDSPHYNSNNMNRSLGIKTTPGGDTSYTSVNSRKTGTPGSERDGKSVSFDDQTSHIQDTPLMFSRCSSLGSLSSFDAYSVHSSIPSEYSRRASEVVSPSDLPDSPSDTMPPTRSESPSVSNRAEADPERRATSRNLLRSKTMPNVPPRIEEKDELFQESVTAYADEDTPTNFSCASSLSALTIDDEPRIEKEQELRQKRPPMDRPPTDRPPKERPPKEKTSSKLANTAVISQSIPEESESSSMSENEEDMLQQCINFGMPAATNSKKKIRKSSSDNSIKKKTSVLNKTESSGTSRNTAIVQPSTSNPRLPKSNTVPGGSGFYGDECLKTYATEDTPLNFSAATSLSDLSVMSGADHKKNTQKPIEVIKMADDLSDSSSCEDDDNLLSEMIQSAMPKKVANKTTKKAAVDRTAEGCDDKDKVKAKHAAPNFALPKGAAQFQPQRTSSHKSPSSAAPARKQGVDNNTKNRINASYPNNANYRSYPNQANNVISQVRSASGSLGHGSDTMMCFKTEDTPVHLSTATSLSDITGDDSDLLRKPGAENVDNSHVTSTAATYGTVPDDSVFFQSQSYDSPIVYGVEGTPLSFSRNDSLSSLSCDDASDLGTTKTKKHKDIASRHPAVVGRQGVTGIPTRSVGNTGIRMAANGTRSHLPTPLTASRSIQTPHQGVSPRQPTYVKQDNKKVPKNIPANSYMSHRTAMSPVTAGHTTTAPIRQMHRTASPGVSQFIRPPVHQVAPNTRQSPALAYNHHEERKACEDSVRQYAVEGTPMSFSRASPLSSLGVSDDEANELPSYQPMISDAVKEQQTHFTVEDTPACFSRNSSLSSLSVDSSCYEPTATEQALLDECISMAMPATKKQSKGGNDKKSRLPRSSPSGSSNGASPDRRLQKMQQEALKTQHDALDKKKNITVMSRSEPAANTSQQTSKSGWSEKKALSADSDVSDKKSKDVTNMHRSLTDTLDSNRRSDELTQEIDSMKLDNEVDEKKDGQKLSPTDLVHYDEEDQDSDEEQNVLFESTIPIPSNRRDNEGNMIDQDEFEAKITYEMEALEINDDDIEIDAGNLSGDLIYEDEEDVQNETVIENNAEPHTPENTTPNMGSGLSPEEEQLLAEGANIAVSELSMMAASTTDDDCLDNECLNFVSVTSEEANEDTASEISRSVSSTTTEETNTAYSVSTESSGPRICKPRICKPVEGATVQKADADTSPKGIRGKRKPLYPGRSPTSPGAANRSSSPRVNTSKTVPKPSGLAVKTARTSSLSPSTRGVSQSPSRRTASQSPTPRTWNKSTLVKSPGGKNSPRLSRKTEVKETKQTKVAVQKQNTNLEKVIDSGTYTKKKSPNKSELIEPDTQAILPTGGAVKLRKKSGSTSDSPPQRTSWENALGSFNFKVDNTIDGQQKVKKVTGGASQNSSGSALTGSKGSLTGSKGSLAGSKGSLSATPGKGNTVSSRSSTPTGRRTPPSGKTPETSRTPTPKKGLGPKKQIVSKIASLWKKDDSEEQPDSSSGRATPPSVRSPRPKQKPAPPVRKSSIPKVSTKSRNSSADGKPPSGRNNSGSSLESNSPRETGVSRSATYDKFPSNDKLNDNEDCTNEAVVNKRRTYVLSEDSDGLAAVDVSNMDTHSKEVVDATAANCTSDISHNDTSSTCGYDDDVWVLQDGSSVASLDQLDTRSVTSLTSLNSNRAKVNASCTSLSSSKSDNVSIYSDTVHVDIVVPNGVIPTEHKGSSQTNGTITRQNHVNSPNKKSPEKRQSREAIVPPFNYKPQGAPDKTDSGDDVTSPMKPLTKTEMLIARRRQSYLNSIKKDPNTENAKTNVDDKGKKTCIITTV